MLFSGSRSDSRSMIIIMFIVGFAGLSIAAKENGSVYLINLSGSDWNLTECEDNDMIHWDFPDFLKNGDTYLVSVEFSCDSDSAKANVSYELVGTDGEGFQITARGNPIQLEAVYTNMEIDGQPYGMRRNLGWMRDREIIFIIVEKNGKYIGSKLDGSNWMKNAIDCLGMKTLNEISIPGTRHSGMNKIDAHTVFGKPCNAIFQSHTIGGQLKLGIRYLDIRPVLGKGGRFFTGSYRYIKKLGNWEGANGQSISSIVNELNYFTKDHNELIIIKFSHSLSTVLGSKKYRKLNQQEWEMLFKKLDKIKNRYCNNNRDVKLKQITLSNYTNNGTKSSVVLIIDDDGSKVELGNRKGKGYFSKCNLNIYGNSTGVSDWSKMVDDQIKKMKKYSESKYFVMYWTLRQSNPQAYECKPTVKELAYRANSHLGHLLYENITDKIYPKTVLYDHVNCTTALTMSLAINAKIHLKDDISTD